MSVAGCRSLATQAQISPKISATPDRPPFDVYKAQVLAVFPELEGDNKRVMELYKRQAEVIVRTQGIDAAIQQVRELLN